MNIYVSQSLILAQYFMLIMSHATAAPFTGFNLCPYFYKAASAVSSNILRHSFNDSMEETVPTPLQSVLQSLPKPQSVEKNVFATKNVRSTVPQYHGRRYHKGILTFEVDKMLATKSTTDLPKAQETKMSGDSRNSTDNSADNIRNIVETTTEKPNGRAYDHNCFFTPMNCQLYLRV